MTPPPDHPVIPQSRVGVLLVNLGTPDAAEPKAVRRYLAEFLSDPRVVEIPKLVWQPILRGVILTTRPKKSAEAYAQVWSEDGSPLAAFTRKKSRALQLRLGNGITVDHAMRYGIPSIRSRLQAMKDAGCERILVAPLYPQYCAATTATANDQAFLALSEMRWQPALRTLPPYHDDPHYVAALAKTVRAYLGGLERQPEVLLASFHGMPQRTLELGDPYHCHCRKTARLLSEALGRPVEVAFQSRFGRAKWLEPATDRWLADAADRGLRSVALIAPGFSADCVETLEELQIRARETFEEHGGTEFHYIPCLNDGEPGMAMLEAIVRRELMGWV